MAEGERPSIEFVDLAPAVGVDEELTPAESAWPRRLVVAAAIVAVLTAVLVARFGGGLRSDSRAHPGPTASVPVSVGLAVPTPLPTPASVVGSGPIPRKAPACVVGVQCVWWVSVPAPTRQAVLDAFPGAVLGVVQTEVINHPGGPPAGLLARELHAEVGRNALVVRVTSGPDRGVTDVTGRAGRGRVEATAHLLGYTISVVLAGRAPLPAVKHLAEDPRLLMTQ
jgi:hypothetical protein